MCWIRSTLFLQIRLCLYTAQGHSIKSATFFFHFIPCTYTSTNLNVRDHKNRNETFCRWYTHADGQLSELADHHWVWWENAVVDVSWSMYENRHAHCPVARAPTPVDYVMAHRRYNAMFVGLHGLQCFLHVAHIIIHYIIIQWGPSDLPKSRCQVESSWRWKM